MISRKHIKRFCKFAIGYLLVYTIVYSALSLFGSYSRVRSSGRSRYNHGIGVADVFVWEPLGMSVFPKKPGDAIACFFWPMILVDRAVVHHDMYLEDIQ